MENTEFEMKDGYEVRTRGKKKPIDYIINDSGEIIAKQCTNCKEINYLNDFKNQSKGFCKKSSECKECFSVRTKQWAEDNVEHRRIYQKKWYSDNIEHIQKYSKDYRIKNANKIKQYEEENKYRIKEYRKAYRKRNREREKELHKAWINDNRGKARLNVQKRRAKRKSLPSTLSIKQKEHLPELQNHKCIISGITDNLHLEHFIPISWGVGGTTFENCYYLEGSLNISKGNRNPFEWIKTQPTEYQSNFHNKLVPMLAERNNMSVEEFTDYVYQCEKEYLGNREPVLS